MHDHLNSFKQNLSQIFHKNFITFEKTPKFFKNPKKLGQKDEMHD